MFRRMPFSAAFLVFLSGCLAGYETVDVDAQPAKLSSAQSGAAKRTIIKNFKDPESARFREMRGYRLSNGDTAICGEVNGRNSYGAYVGYKLFYLRFQPTSAGQELKSIKHEFLAEGPCRDLAVKRRLAIGTH